MDPMDCNLSDSSSSPPAETIHVHSSTSKRTASDAGLKGMRPPKSVKRRASKACQCCRSRKVRCNVVEHGAPCTNCRLDEVECIVSESKRKKLVILQFDYKASSNLTMYRKWTTNETSPAAKSNTLKPAANVPMSAHPPYEPLRRSSEHVPHSLCKSNGSKIISNAQKLTSHRPRPKERRSREQHTETLD